MADDDVKNFEMIEVDPKLFITCRLCLEDMGLYQIVPTVQYQIKYCFDINVEPFDGLPQLLCKQCKTLLSEYSETKKKFTEKQDSLRKSLEIKKNNNIEPREREASQDEKINQDLKGEVIPPLKINKKRINRIFSTSSSDSENFQKNRCKVRRSNSKSGLGWKKNYNKKFACNLCSKSFRVKQKLTKHMKSHSKFKSKYQNVNFNCSVQLEKFDNKPNITGSDNTVMLSQDKIIENVGKTLYHVVYTSKESCSNLSDTKNDYSRKATFSESSDEEVFVSKSKRKNHRLISRSSNDTVVLDSNDKNPENSDGNVGTTKSNNNTQGTECINIDDSSDSGNELDTEIQNENCSALFAEPKIAYKTIDNIISVCRNKYLKKIELSQKNNEKNIDKKIISNMETQLKHKVLSIGRKILNKDVKFNNNGLLRYMEHKNLDIEWLPKSQVEVNAGKENYIRIMSRLKGDRLSNNSDDDSGWKDLPENEDFQTDINIGLICKTSEADKNMINVTVNADKRLSTLTATKSPVIILDKPIAASITSTAACNISNIDAEGSSRKLLNPNPVANPKQLPRKSNTQDYKSPNISKNAENNSEAYIVPLNSELDESNMVMPVITSTTSLANVVDEEKKDEPSGKTESSNDKINTTEKSFPRIKVKPASELMKPENMLHVNKSLPENNFWNVNNQSTVNIYIPNLMVPQIQNVQSLKIVSNPNVMPVDKVTSEGSSKEYIILHTVQMPNTKTSSPFQYLQQLLMLHQITLLEPSTTLPSDYACLLKFKVQFKQENKDKPVTLCLSLFCKESIFSISIQDSHQTSISMNRISANWQWEIIKIFQGDVSQKILQNAQKAGNFVLNYTKSFVYLLKSIICIQE